MICSIILTAKRIDEISMYVPIRLMAVGQSARTSVRAHFYSKEYYSYYHRHHHLRSRRIVITQDFTFEGSQPNPMKRQISHNET